MKENADKRTPHIVLLQSICLNERGWAKVASAHGRVSLIQEGWRYIEHVETWEGGNCTFLGPENRVKRWFDFLDGPTFGITEGLGVLRHCWPVLKSERTDVVIANANAQALAALFLRLTGRTRKVVCLVADYFPPHGPLIVRIHRRLSGTLTRWLCRHSDEAWALSQRIPTAKVNPRNFVVPMYVNDEAVPPGIREEIMYIGNPTPDHGLDILFDICRRHELRLNVLGQSPYLDSIKHLAPPTTIFHGFSRDPAKIKAISARSFCGYAIYRNVGPHNYSYFGAPSKMLSYFANNTPVITTNVADFSQSIEKLGIGHVVEPVPEQIERAILDVRQRYGEFYEAINRFRQEWNARIEQFYSDRLNALLKD